MDVMIERIVAVVVWLVANVVYLDMKRQGTRGFRRLLAFWFGTPTTWVTFFLLREGTQPRIEPSPDADRQLLADIERDRLARGLRPRSSAQESGGAPPPRDAGPNLNRSET